MTTQQMIEIMQDKNGDDYYDFLQEILLKMSRRIDELEADLAATVNVRLKFDDLGYQVRTRQ